MQEKKVSIDCAKLVGFANVQNGRDAIDFKNKTIDARLGAKVGGEGPCVASDLREMGLKLPSDGSKA